MMSPSEAGQSGAAIAGLADAAQGMAQEQFSILHHMRQAQMHVDTLAAENDLNAAYIKLQDDLRKTTNSRDVDEVLRGHEDNLNDISKKWDKSPAAIQIQMRADGLKPDMQHMATVRQVDLMGKEWGAQVQVQVDALLPQYVMAKRSGDTLKAKAITDKFDQMYDQGIATGITTPADKQMAQRAFQIAAQKESNEAVVESPNAAERKQAIEQLTKGGNGPLDLTNVSAGEVASMRIHAQETDERITRLAEAGNLNNALNTYHSAFAAPEYHNNYEGRQKALEDGDWLTQHGIVTPDGSPDRVMADKLISENERQRAVWKREQDDRDDKIIDKWAPEIEQGKVPESSIERLSETEGASPKAISHLRQLHNQVIRQNREEWRMERSMSLAERQDAKRDQDEKSANLAAQVALELSSGKVYETADIRMMDGLNTRDKLALTQMVKDPNPFVKDGLVKINDLALQKTESRYELARIFMEQVKQGDLRGAQITQALKPLIENAVEKEASGLIDQAFQNLQMRHVLPNSTLSGPAGNRMDNLRRALAVPERPKSVPEGYVWNPGGNNGRGSWDRP
jgi:hypothetical protein